MAACSSFWSTVQVLQEQNVLCDIQLTVSTDEDSTFDAINVHKVILASCSKFFHELLLKGELWDAYSILGVSIENLQLVVDYMYRRISWEELTKVPEAANTAQTIQVHTHDTADQAGGKEPCILSSDLSEPKKEKGGQSLSKSNEKKGLKGRPGISKKGPLVGEGVSNSRNARSSTSQKERIPAPRLKRSLKSSENCPPAKKQVPDKMDSTKPKLTDVMSGSNVHGKSGNDGSPLTTNLTSTCRTSRRKRKPLNYKHLSEGRDIFDDDADVDAVDSDKDSNADSNTVESQGSASEKKRSNNVEDENDFIPEQPPKKKKMKPPKPITNVMYVGDGSSQDSLAELSGEKQSVPQDKDLPKDKPGQAQSLLIKSKIPNCTTEKEDKPQVVSDSGKGEGESETVSSDANSAGETDVSKPDYLQAGASETSQKNSDCGKGDTAVSAPAGKTEQRWPSILTNPFPCDKCRRNFKSENTLRKHQKIIHNIKEVVKCSVCEEEFDSTAQRDKHIKTHDHVVMYSCQECQMQFKSKEGYYVHWHKKHSGEGPAFQCEYCDRQFFLRGELRSHIQYKHTASRDFQCEQCSRAFKSKAMLARHVSTYHSNVRKFKCEVCERMFKTMNDCKAHQRKHFREKNPLAKDRTNGTKFPNGQKYQCRYCDKVFEKRSRQLVHENFQHKQKNDGTSFLCTLCSKVFAIKHYLMQHIKHCHSERRYSCPNCQQTFAQKVDVKKHYSIPGRCKGVPPDPKPFSCHQCGKGFSLKGNLGKHLQRPGRCRGANTRNPDVIVVLQQTEGQEEAAEGSTEAESGATNVVVGTDGQQYELKAETSEGFTHTDVEGAGVLARPRIVQLEQGDHSVALQGIVEGKLVPVTVTSEEDGEVQYQVVTGVYNMVNPEQQTLVTYDSREQLEGQHVHLVEETVMEESSGEQVYTLMEKIPSETEVMDGVEGPEAVVGGTDVMGGEMVVESHSVLTGHEVIGGTQIVDEERLADNGPVFTPPEGKRVIIQGDSIIPIEEGVISVPHTLAQQGGGEGGGVEPADIEEEQEVLHVGVDLGLTE